MVDEESKSDVVKEVREMLASGALILPLRVEGWHMSLNSGGWYIKNASDRILMTVAFVPVEIETGKPALEGNAPARYTVALLNSVPALCNEVEELRSLNQTQAESIVAFQEQQRSYQRRLFEECVAANWDPEKRNTFAEEIAHLHEELSEAFRAWRRNKDFRITVDENGKPQGVPIELADALIGLFYNAELHGFDLFAAVEQKHQYNLTRNYVHEGRQLHAEVADDHLI